MPPQAAAAMSTRAAHPLTGLLAAAALLLCLSAAQAQAQAQAGASPAASPAVQVSGNLLATAQSDLPPECTAADLVPANIAFLGAAKSIHVGEPGKRMTAARLPTHP